MGHSSTGAAQGYGIDRYPFAIVWTPIHPISWFLPFVGHMGVCDSNGICFDFTGDICVDQLAFGRPTR